MTGWRLGWIAAPLWIAKACSKLQGQYTSGPSSIAQKAAEAAYLGEQACVETMRQAFERRRDLVISLVKEIKGLKVSIPDGAFYVFPECNSFFGKKTPKGDVIANANDLAMYILMEGHVACVSGDAFGDKNCIRMSYATSEENIKEAFRRIKECLDAIK
jgi:aspartate aminotransferase